MHFQYGQRVAFNLYIALYDINILRILSSSPWMQDLLSYFYVFFSFFKQMLCSSVCKSFTSLVTFIHLVFYFSWCYFIGFKKNFSFWLLWLSWQRIHLQCGRPRFDPWVGKIPWRRERLPTPVFWPGEFHGLCSPWGRKESDPTEWLTLSLSLLDCSLVVYRNATDFCWFYSFQLCWINFSNRSVCICAFVCVYNL